MRLNLKQHLELHHLGGCMLLPTQGGAWLCLPSFPWINPKIDHPWTFFCLKLVCWNSLTSAIRIKVRCGYVPKGKLGRHWKIRAWQHPILSCVYVHARWTLHGSPDPQTFTIAMGFLYAVQTGLKLRINLLLFLNTEIEIIGDPLCPTSKLSIFYKKSD